MTQQENGNVAIKHTVSACNGSLEISIEAAATELNFKETRTRLNTKAYISTMGRFPQGNLKIKIVLTPSGDGALDATIEAEHEPLKED